MLRRGRLWRAIVSTTTKEKFTLSRLTNGLRVLTCDDGSGITGLGLFTLNGCKFEDAQHQGAAAVYESLPLLGNQLYSERELSSALGMLGNAFVVINNREAMSAMLMVPRYHRTDGLQLLDAMCLHLTKDEAVYAQAKAIALQRAALALRDATTRCFDLVHEAGWSGAGLGNPSVPTPEVLQRLDLAAFSRFHARHIRPERAVLAATGVDDHDTFALEVEALLHFDADGGGGGGGGSGDGGVDASPYTGGCRLVQQTTAPESLSKFEERNLSHVALFLRGVPMNHRDYYAISVMQTLLGGGTSFSSGGPGKGMHTRIYRDVLSKAGWIHGLECITAWYSDAGLLGLYGSAAHEHVQQLLSTTLSQALRMSDAVGERELQMARNQLLSQIILLGEGREQLLNDMGFNLLVHDFTITPQETMEGSARVTVHDLRRVHAAMLQAPPTYVVLGETAQVPSYEQLRQKLADGAAAVRAKL